MSEKKFYQIPLRMDKELRHDLKIIAKDAGRSVNKHLVVLLRNHVTRWKNRRNGAL